MYCGVVITSWTEILGFPARGILQKGQKGDAVALKITPQKNSAIGTP